MDDLLKDRRFAHVAKDPRFRKMPVGERKVKIDNRFKGMFTDKRFKLKYSVDKRGKPVNLTTNENLKKYYELSDEDSSESENNEDCESTVVNDSTAAEHNERDIHMMNSKKEKNTRSLSESVLKHDSDDSSDSSDYEDGDTDVNISRRDTNKKSESIDPRFHMKKDSDTDISDKDKYRKNKKSESVHPRFEMKFSKKNKQQCTQMKDKLKVHERDEPVLNDKGKTMKCKKDIIQGVADEDNSEVGFNESESGSSIGSSGDENSDDEVEQKPVGKDSGVDLARGDGNMYSSSSDDDEDDVEIGDNDIESKFDHRWGEADDNVVSMDEATSRLAVCNMDWDRMKAKDIYVLLNSFKPTNGIIKSVKVYPSDYGKERMVEEARHGPHELKDLKMDSDEEEDDVAQEGTSFQREKLREYQLNRLRYYYAVVDCDSTDTADHVYKECDGIEYESSATKLDLRFIPDEETFEDGDVESVCTEIPGNYKPQYFFNAALAQSKVELTWDETDRERVQLTSRQYSGKDDVAEEDLKAYLASSSDDEAPDYSAFFGNAGEDGESGEESDEDSRIDKYKRLLTDIDSEEKKKKPDVEMEISWEPGLREATENLVKKKKQSKDSTVWEDYLQKKKEKKKQRIEERKKKQKSQEESDSDNTQTVKEVSVSGETQAFSDDELPADADMAAFMAEEKPNTKMKKNKKKKKKKKTDEENTEISKEKAELSLLLMDEEDNRKHFNLRDLVQEDGKKKKTKKKKEKDQKNQDVDEDFKMNVTDPRFSAVFESHLFNIDPSAPEYRKTKGTEAIISEKIKRSGKRDKNRDQTKRTPADKEDEQVKKQKVMDKQTLKEDNLASLIKSVKSKTKHFHSNKANR